jgi:hypothetical protein
MIAGMEAAGRNGYSYLSRAQTSSISGVSAASGSLAGKASSRAIARRRDFSDSDAAGRSFQEDISSEVCV